MSITYIQVHELLTSIAIAAPDQLECDGCFELISEFADAEKRGEELTNALKAVQIHLEQCPCCAYEYESLLEALYEADES